MKYRINLFRSPNYFDSEGNLYDFETDELVPSLPANDCTIKLTPKNAAEKVYISEGLIFLVENIYDQPENITGRMFI